MTMSEEIDRLKRMVARLQGQVSALRRAEKRRQVDLEMKAVENDAVMSGITNAVADGLGIEPSDIRGRRKSRALVCARYEAMKRCREAGKSRTDVATYFGVHRSTVIYAETRGER